MSQATLLNIPDDPAGRSAFNFEHSMAHREMMQAMGPLSQWSVMPYFLDPTIWTARPGEPWHHNHQQCHNDMNSYLPADRSMLQPGMPSQIVRDSYLPNRESRTWWTFINHQEQYVACQAILPLPLTEPLPWWLQQERLVENFW